MTHHFRPITLPMAMMALTWIGCSHPTTSRNTAEAPPAATVVVEEQTLGGKTPLTTTEKFKDKALPKKLAGKCRIMNPPGTSPNLFEPCRKATLLLGYKVSQRPVVSIISTDQEGRFEFEVPKNSPWSISTSKDGLVVDLEFLTVKKRPEVSVVLRPAKAGT